MKKNLLNPVDVVATFKMLMEHPSTKALTGAPVYVAGDVVEYLFDGHMPCLLVEQDGVIIDYQDCSYEMLMDGEPADGRATYKTLEAWAQKYIKDMTMAPA